VIRANGGIFYARVPGLNLASTRSTNGSLGYDVFRNSALTGILGPVPAYPNIIPLSTLPAVPFQPGVFVFDKNFKNPRTYAASVGVDKEIANDYAVCVKYNYAHTIHITRFVDRNDPLLGLPWATGLAGGNGLGTLTTVEGAARSIYNGVTFNFAKRYSNNF